MITFTDPRLYVQGIGTAIMTDIVTGDIKYFSDKFQEGNITLSADDGIINAGIGNAPVAMIPSNSNVQVTVTAADYSEYAKAAAVGGKISAGAPVMVCKKVNSGSSTTSLNVGTDAGVPTTGPGMALPCAYVQQVGDISPIARDGVAYNIDSSGNIPVNVTADTDYVVWYYANRANASMTTISSNMKGEVVRFVLQRPIYTNVDQSANQGDLWGYIYEVIPRLQLMPDGGSNSGNQTSPTTTGITGRAMTYDAETIPSDACSECQNNGSPLMYRIIVPCDKNAGIEGILGVIGGVVSVKVGESVTLTPAVIVNGRLVYGSDPFAFSITGSATATVGQYTGIVTGVLEGSCEVKVTKIIGSTTYIDYVNVEVTSA